MQGGISREENRGNAKGPLDGVRVLDLSRLVAGNQLTLVLADFGAEVIKIEQPGRGDSLRDWAVAGEKVYWSEYARNKKSVSLDLKSHEGRDILLRLVEDAQVLVESFRPGKLEDLRLGPDVLLGRNPRLVVTRVSGWGQTGPYASRPGFGTLVEAMSGFAAMNGFADREPTLPPLSLADMVAGLYGAAATVMAVRHAEATNGSGQVVDLSLLESLLPILGPQAAIFKLTDKVPARTGSRSQTAAPRNVYRTRDGKWLAISASTQVMTERLLRVIGCEHLTEDPKFRTNADRLAHIEELDEIIAARIGERTLDENMDLMVRESVTAAPVYTTEQLVGDPHIKGREVFIEPSWQDGGQSLPMHNVVPRLSLTPGEIRSPAPKLGEHNQDVLGAFLSKEELLRLIETGVIYQEEV